jgi:hypothetical protein
MSYRKTKLIQEKNILIENKRLLEQNVVTTTTTKKMDRKSYDNLSLCSSVKNPPNPIEIKTEFGVVLQNPSGKAPYCRKE